MEYMISVILRHWFRCPYCRCYLHKVKLILRVNNMAPSRRKPFGAIHEL